MVCHVCPSDFQESTPLCWQALPKAWTIALVTNSRATSIITAGMPFSLTTTGIWLIPTGPPDIWSQRRTCLRIWWGKSCIFNMEQLFVQFWVRTIYVFYSLLIYDHGYDMPLLSTICSVNMQYTNALVIILIIIIIKSHVWLKDQCYELHIKNKNNIVHVQAHQLQSSPPT